MFEGNHPNQIVEQLPPQVKCEVKLPPEWNDLRYLPRGLLPTCSNDRRRFPRCHYRVRAILQCRETFPALWCSREPYMVYTENISRGGLAFLHSEQLFPRQQICIFLPGGVQLDLQVVRCRQLHERCFEVGARFAVAVDHATMSDLLKQYRS